MKRKACIAGAMALALLPCEATAQATTSFVTNPYIEKISCLEGSGTGFKLETGQWVSVNHVTRLTNCTIDGLPIVVTHVDEARDFSTFTIPGDRRAGGLKADCGGYQDRQWYHGQGHAGGLPVITSVPVMYSKVLNEGPTPKGWAVLVYNRFIPGQSGGPSFNNQGAVTGTVNAYSPIFLLSFSTALKDTVICQK